MSEPLDLVSQVPRTDTLRGAPMGPLAPLGSLSTGYVRRGVSESGDLLAPKPNRHDNSFSDFCSTAPCLSLNLRPPPPDQPTVKSLGALQQICEEEEDEDDEKEEVDLEVAPDKLDLFPSTDLSLKPSRISLQSETQRRTGMPSSKVMGNCETVTEEEELDEGSELTEEQNKPSELASNVSSGTIEHQIEMPSKTEARVEFNHTEQPGRGRGKEVFTQPSLSLDEQEGEQIQDPNIDGPPPAPTLDVVQCCWGQREPSKDTLENNNNTLAKSRLLEVGVVSTPCGSPRSLPRNHCVDLGPDGVEMRKTAAEVEKTEEVQPKPQTGLQETRDTSTDSAIRADPSKVKNVNLRERLLQFPLCEKALSFNIQPTSKEKLLPFAQYNCCHVL